MCLPLHNNHRIIMFGDFLKMGLDRDEKK